MLKLKEARRDVTFIGAILTLICGALTLGSHAARGADLVGHWPLSQDSQSTTGTHHAQVHGGIQFVEVDGRPAANFNGRDGYLEVPDDPELALSRGDFSVSLWVNPRRPLLGIPGDLVSKWDGTRRRGINFYLTGGSSAYSSISDTRHVHFGVDDAHVGPEVDHGRPWPSNSLISNLVVYQGNLYAGIADADDPKDSARVFRLVEGQVWEDCGQIGGGDPTIASVMSMVVHDGQLYAGTGRWDWVISKGNDPKNPPPRSTRVYVYEGGTSWRDLGPVGKGSRVLCLASFKGTLFAGIDKVGGGHLYRREGEEWLDCGSPDGRNLECVMPYNGGLYVATHGNFYRYEEDGKFTPLGVEPHGITQIHCMHVHAGKLVAGTWPQGYVLRFAGGEQWDIMGRLGLDPGRSQINELNSLIHHNGKLYAGVIPRSELYRYEEGDHWENLKQLGRRADWSEGDYSTWVRLTALASYRGRLFAGSGSSQGRALDAPVDPSLGRVTSFGFGQMASYENDLPGGWVHLAAIRRSNVLEVFVNGKLAAKSLDQPENALDVSNTAPLRFGLGDLTYYDGALRDIRIYRGALSDSEIAQLADESGVPPLSATPADHVRVAGVVLKWVPGDREANFRRFEKLMREAAAGGAKIVGTTECFLDGYAIGHITDFPKDYPRLAEPIPEGTYYRKLEELCKELQVYLVAGIAEAESDTIYNSAVVIGPDGKLIGVYHKQDLEHEAERMKPGKESPVFATEYGQLGVVICADRRNAGVVKRICSNGADFVICASGGMAGPKDNDHILQARSRENGKYIVFVHPKEFLVTAPDGAVAVQNMLGTHKSVTAAEIDSEEDSKGVFYFDLPLKRDR